MFLDVKEVTAGIEEIVLYKIYQSCLVTRRSLFFGYNYLPFQT